MWISAHTFKLPKDLTLKKKKEKLKVNVFLYFYVLKIYLSKIYPSLR